MDYFDVVRLFDKAMFDSNSIRHFIYNMQDRYDQKINRLWTEVEYQRCEKFIVGHKACGLHVRLVLTETEAEDSHSEKPKIEDEFIQGTGTTKVVKQPELKVIRGRGGR